MTVIKLNWNVDLFSQAGANAVTDCLDQVLLGRLLCVVDTKDVLSLGWGFMNFFDHAGQVSDVDGRHKVVAFSDDWKTLWFLEPGLLEVTIEDFFALTIEDTG